MTTSSYSDRPGALNLYKAIVARARFTAVLALIVGFVIGIASALSPTIYQSNTVLGVVGAGGGSPALGGAASLLGGALNLQSLGSSSTGAVISYLLTSRIVLDSVIRDDVSGVPLLERLTGQRISSISVDKARKLARKHISVSSSRETGFISLAVRGQDPEAVSTLASELVRKTQSIYSDFQRSQARTVRMSQQARVDSFAAALATAEDSTQVAERMNGSARAGTRGELELRRLRRDRDAIEYAYQSARSESEAALGRELLNAASVVVLEPGDQMVDPLETRPLYRGLLAGAVTAALSLLATVTRHLALYARPTPSQAAEA